MLLFAKLHCSTFPTILCSFGGKKDYKFYIRQDILKLRGRYKIRKGSCEHFGFEYISLSVFEKEEFAQRPGYDVLIHHEMREHP